MDQVPVTSEGKRRMREELSELEAQVPAITKAIEEAREQGDLKENAEYHAAREKLGLLNGQIAELKGRIANAVEVDSSKIDTSKVAFGAIVELEDRSDGSVEEWFLVGQGEDDPLENKILTTSPMGSALIGHGEGEEVVVEAPAGKMTFQIRSIRYGE